MLSVRNITEPKGFLCDHCDTNGSILHIVLETTVMADTNVNLCSLLVFFHLQHVSIPACIQFHWFKSIHKQTDHYSVVLFGCPRDMFVQKSGVLWTPSLAALLSTTYPILQKKAQNRYGCGLRVWVRAHPQQLMITVIALHSKHKAKIMLLLGKSHNTWFLLYLFLFTM